MASPDRRLEKVMNPGSQTEEPLLRIEQLHKSFGDHEVLKGVSLSVAKGEVIAIVGASGSGKSTLLRCVNVLEIPTSGRMYFGGREIDYLRLTQNRAGARELAELRASVGMVFQSYNLWPHRTVLENVTEAPVHVKGVPRVEAVAEAESLLESIGLSDKRNEYPARLSGGQQQRVAIVRALAMKPVIMLFDEVTSALDPELVGEVLDLMTDLASQDMTMLVVTHEMGFARHVSHRVIFVHEGEFAEEAPAREFFASPNHPATRQFLSRILRDDQVERHDVH